MYHLKVFGTIFIFITCTCFTCNSEHSTKTQQSVPGQIPAKEFSLNKPTRGQTHKLHSNIIVELKSTSSIIPDSVLVYFNNELVATKMQQAQFMLNDLLIKTGTKTLHLKVYYNGGIAETLICTIKAYSDAPPRELSYKLVQKLPHEKSNYTQGLFIHNNSLYESTGINGSSRITKSDIDNRNILLEHKLDKQFFGEGITLVDDKIYQLTYVRRTGFVYNVNTFEKLAEFKLPVVEGWGLTYDGSNLIISDGSAQLHFYHPEHMNKIKNITVANNKRFIRYLNELEYVNGTVWANIYTTNLIVQIDPESGKVIGELNLSSLFPENIPNDMDHVLNGIAYHPERNTFFVTGKLWPVMYEITIE